MTTASNRPAALASRLALITFGLAMSVAALEVVLHAGAAYNRGALQRDAPMVSGRANRIVCLGDSNTFGITMPRDSTYPAFLQELLASDASTASVEVLNLGVPGTNSSLLRGRIDSVIDSFQPDTLLVMIGANDFWTLPVPVSDEEPSWRQRLWSYSRVYRLLYMLARSVTREEVNVVVENPIGGRPRGVVRHGDVEIDISWTGRSSGETVWREPLVENLRAIAALATRREVNLVLLTYPSEGRAYGTVNRIIRAAASGIPLIDLGRDFSTACPQLPCPGLFLPDLHPNALGYQVAATLVWRRIRERYGAIAVGQDSPADRLFPSTATYLRRLDQVTPTH